MKQLTEEKLQLIFKRFEFGNSTKMNFNGFMAAYAYIVSLNKLDVEAKEIERTDLSSKIAEIERDMCENPKSKYTWYDLRKATDELLNKK